MLKPAVYRAHVERKFVSVLRIWQLLSVSSARLLNEETKELNDFEYEF